MYNATADKKRTAGRIGSVASLRGPLYTMPFNANPR